MVPLSKMTLNIQISLDLDLWIVKGKTCIIAKIHRTGLVICSHSREGLKKKTCLKEE